MLGISARYISTHYLILSTSILVHGGNHDGQPCAAVPFVSRPRHPRDWLQSYPIWSCLQSHHSAAAPSRWQLGVAAWKFHGEQKLLQSASICCNLLMVHDLWCFMNVHDHSVGWIVAQKCSMLVTVSFRLRGVRLLLLTWWCGNDTTGRINSPWDMSSLLYAEPSQRIEPRPDQHLPLRRHSHWFCNLLIYGAHITYNIYATYFNNMFTQMYTDGFIPPDPFQTVGDMNPQETLEESQGV